VQVIAKRHTPPQGENGAGTAPHPHLSRNMFNVKDISNMFSLMEPRLLCILHRAMFMEGELQKLEWHWESKEVPLLS
jgi:hypothetical protein